MVTICEGGRGRVWKWARLETALLAQINVEARINFTKSEKKKNFVLYNVDVPPRRSIYRTNSGM